MSESSDPGVRAAPDDGAARQSSRPGAAARGANRLNRWLTLGANLCVVLGLVILIVEVRQNAELTRASMEIGQNEALTQVELSLANPDVSAAWVKSIRTPESLSDVEIRVVESHLVAVMLQWDHMFNMEKIGLVSRAEARRHIQNVAPFYFGSRHGKNWWRWQKAGWEGTPMMEVAGPIVEALDEGFMLRYLEGTRLGAAAQERGAAEGIEREARAFMAAYGQALESRDRSGVAGRYSASGATIILDGARTTRSKEEIVARYRDAWAGPDSFGWRDLTYEALGPDTIIVSGGFDWGSSTGVTAYSYASVLQREQGELRIRLEVESSIPVREEGEP